MKIWHCVHYKFKECTTADSVMHVSLSIAQVSLLKADVFGAIELIQFISGNAKKQVKAKVI